VKPGAPAKPAAATKPAAPGKEAKAAAEKKAAPAAEKKVAKPAAEPATSKAKQAPVAAKPAGAYAIEMDGDLVESELGAVTAKLKRAGISHVVKTTSHKNETMHRLYLADFANHDEAAEELQRLKAAAPSAFLLKENGRYTIYAGSYLREGKAAVEQDRLFNKGVKLLLKSATVSVPVVKLRAGSFADKAAAAKAVNKLKQAGLSAKVVKVGK
jgi:cell division septation protein DedD